MGMVSYFVILREGGHRLEPGQHATKAAAVAAATLLAGSTGRTHLILKAVGQAVPAAAPAAYEDAT